MKRFKLIFTFLAILLSGINLNAQWVRVSNGMDNDKVIYAFANNGNNFFAGTDWYGVYLSTNAGSNWTQTSMFTPRIRSLAVNGNNTFAGTLSFGVYLSTNNGANWGQTSLNNQTILSLAANGNNVFAGTASSGVYLSINNGTNWTQTSLYNQTVSSLAVNGNNVFASYGADVYLSTNNGVNWTETSLNHGARTLVVNGNNIFAGTGSGLYLSTNSGTTWTQIIFNRTINSLAVQGNNIFAGTTAFGVLVSTDNGADWSIRNEGLGFATVNALCIINNYLFAGTSDSSVYRRPLSELTGIQPISTEVPEQFSLSQNYPNPFNPTTNVQFSIINVQYVTLKIFDATGKEVSTIVNEELRAGTYEVDWDGSSFSSGIYYYTLQTEGFTETRKMVLMK